MQCLIDCHTAEPERNQWCELEQAVFPLPEMAVPGFESLIQPVDILLRLRRLAAGLGL